MARNKKDVYGFEPFYDADLGINYVRPPRPSRYNPHDSLYLSARASGSNMIVNGEVGQYKMNRTRQGVNFKMESTFGTALPNAEVCIDYFPSEDSGKGFNVWADETAAPSPLEILDLPTKTHVRIRDAGIGLGTDGVIEPQSIRNMISHNFIDEFVEKLPRAHLMDGNLDAFDGASRISQTKPRNSRINSSKAYFIDSQTEMGNTAILGYLSENQTKIKPFSDSESYVALDGVTDPGIRHELISSSLTLSGTHILNGYPYGEEELYAVGGTEYQGAYNIGIDSVSFGDRNEFFARGYQHLRDSLINTYPKVARHDNNRSGLSPIKFDDQNTIPFNRAVSIEYGRNIQTSTSLSSSLSGSEVSDPEHIVYPLIGQQRYVVRNLDGAITGPGNVIKGLTDNQYIPGADKYLLRGPGTMDPFIESSLYIDNESSFYTTGTDGSHLAGFSSKLSSKTILQFDISPAREGSVFWSTGSITTVTDGSEYTDSNAGYVNGGIHSGLSYFNWTDKQWEPVGNLVTGSNVDYMNRFLYIFTSSYLAVIPPQEVNSTTLNTTNVENTFGLPTPSCGFPIASKFNATSSQLLSLDDRISAPFLLEKVVVEMSATIPGPVFYKHPAGDLDPTVQDVSPTTFMLLRQSNANLDGEITKSTKFRTLEMGPADSVYNPTTGSIIEPSYSVDNPMDVIWTGRVALYDSTDWDSLAALSSSHPGYYTSADLWIPIDTSAHLPAVNPLYGFTGSIRLEAPVKNMNIGESQSRLLLSRARYYLNSDNDFVAHWTGSREYILGNPVGGCNLFDLSCGRRIIKSVTGGKFIGNTTYNAGDFEVPRYETVQSVAPYFLLPTDKLVFCAVKQRMPAPGTLETYGSKTDIAGEPGVAADKLNLHVGDAKLTFFGSNVVNNKETHDTLNQELTSDAIHEAIMGLPVTDQVIGENNMSFYGSYIDNILTGTFLSGDRGVAGSVIAGQAGVTASLSRMVRLKTNERFYDTLLPSIQDIFNISNKKLFNSGNDFLMLGQPGTTTHNDDVVFSSWTMAYPFEPKYANASRLQDFNYFDKDFQAEDKDGAQTPDSQIEYFGLTGSLNLVRRLLGYNFGNAEKILIANEGVVRTVQAERMAPLKFFFGIGNGPYNLPTFDRANPTISSNRYQSYVVANPVIRGFKYGLLNIVPQFTSQVYRYDSYGQFRDMLEQRTYSRLLRPDGTLLSAIETKFVDKVGNLADPYQTNGLAMTAGSNLSLYSTSSLPYFDGEYRNGILTGSL
jgi:hypothetical protein